jgi:hypothetical protein
MRIVITVEDSPPPAAGEPSSSDRGQAQDAGASLAVSYAAGDQAPPGPADRALTENATSAGPAGESPTSAEPVFLDDSATIDASPDSTHESGDLSAGPAPALT